MLRAAAVLSNTSDPDRMRLIHDHSRDPGRGRQCARGADRTVALPVGENDEAKLGRKRVAERRAEAADLCAKISKLSGQGA